MGARILIIEDNPANLDLMMYLLRAFGHTPLSATDGNEGFELARRLMPDLIICDVQLPGLNGYDLARRLKADRDVAGIPLLAITAFAMPGDREKALAAGFDAYIAKPIAPESILTQLDGFLPPSKHSERQTRRSSEPRVPNSQWPAEQQLPPASRQLETSRRRTLARTGTILVVDDSRVNRDLIRSTLEPLGFKLILAGSLAEAVSVTEQMPVDVVLSDLHMPDGDGYDLIRVLKADSRNLDTPIVIITSSSSGVVDQQMMASLGAAGLIVRPIEPDELLAQVQASLQDARDPGDEVTKR